MDLANPTMVNTWRAYYQSQKQWHVFVNAHNKDSVKNMLREMKVPLDELIKQDRPLLGMMVGMPNVGKSALMNSLQSALVSKPPAKGNPLRAEVGPSPGVTRKISSYQIDYFPKTYLLDTPGVLPPEIGDSEWIKLATTGILDDAYIDEQKLARYMLAMLNIGHSGIHAKWLAEAELKGLLNTPVDGQKSKKWKLDPESKIEVRGIIASTRMNFAGDLEREDEINSLIDSQIRELCRAFAVPEGAGHWKKVAKKIISLYRTGKLGSHTWDESPV